MTDVAELVVLLRAIEESLRDLAYEALSSAVDGDTEARAHERSLLQARRGVERALHALEPDRESLD